MNYWKPETQTAIINYTTATTTEEKNKIFNQHLITPITLLVRQALYSCTSSTLEDEIQDLLIFIYEKVLPKIEPDKLKGVQNYIWIATTRHIYSNYAKNINKPKYTTTLTGNVYELDYYISTTEENIFDTNSDIEEIRQEIMKEIDKKIINEKIINKRNTIFLILLKEYLIENDYDCRGFRKFCMEEMNLKRKSYFVNIASKLGIRTQEMNIEIIK